MIASIHATTLKTTTINNHQPTKKPVPIMNARIT
jgi:hypothetical protein